MYRVLLFLLLLLLLLLQDDMTPSDPILSFLNDATIEELTSMNGCSKKKAEIILSERPFADWDDLVRVLPIPCIPMCPSSELTCDSD